MKLRDTARFDTICIHAGQTPDASTGAIVTPIYQTSTYVQESLGVHKGYEYARTQNPTRAALEGNLAAMENGKAAFGFASGMAATSTVMTLLRSGDHVVVTDNIYGGTYRLFEHVLRKYQLDFTYADTSHLGESIFLNLTDSLRRNPILLRQHPQRGLFSILIQPSSLDDVATAVV